MVVHRGLYTVDQDPIRMNHSATLREEVYLQMR